MATPKRSGPNTHWFEYEINTLKSLSGTHSSKEIAEVLGRTYQAVQSKAYRMNISIDKECNTTYRGRKAEEDALKILNGGKLLTRDCYHASYDIDWDGKRINVKSSTLRYNPKARCDYWHFTKRQTPDKCDFYLLLGYTNYNLMPEKAWLVPSNFYKGTSIQISHFGKKNMFQKFVLKDVI